MGTTESKQIFGEISAAFTLQTLLTKGFGMTITGNSSSPYS